MPPAVTLGPPARPGNASVPPAGPGAFVAYPSMLGGYERAITKAAQLGLRWLAPRGGQRGRDANWSSPQAIRIIAMAKSQGIAIYPWIYSHPDAMHAEIELCRQFVAEGAAGVILDAEDPWKSPGNPGLALQKKALATRYMQDLRQVLPDVFVAHCPYAFPDYHADFPFVEFGLGCDLVMPQLYWTEFNDAGFRVAYDKATAQWAQWNVLHPNSARPIAYVGVTYGAELKGVAKPPPGKMHTRDFQDFVVTCAGQTCLPVYSLEVARADVLDVMFQLWSPTSSPKPEPGLQLGTLAGGSNPLGWVDRAERDAADREAVVSGPPTVASGSQPPLVADAFGSRWYTCSPDEHALWDRRPFAYRPECTSDCAQDPSDSTVASPPHAG